MKIAPFWMVMRLSQSSGVVQGFDSMPNCKHPTKTSAMAEAARLANQWPNSKAFVVMQCVGGVAPLPRFENVEVDYLLPF